MTRSDKPEALVVMGRDTFELQFDQVRLARLRELTNLGDPVWADEMDSAAVRERATDVEILITSWGCPRLDEARLALLPRLTAVFHCAGSVRSLVSEGLWRRGIAVTNAADGNAIPVAEYTLAAITFAGKQAPFLAADARTHREDWSYISRRGDLSNYGRTVGIVGFSRVGRLVVGRMRDLETAECLVSDPYADAVAVKDLGARLVPLDEMLPLVDILSLHAPQLPQTDKMIGAAELAMLHDKATVINTARGSLMDTAALERECASGRLSAILDVTDPEPLPASSVLYSLPNVMLTPHIAGSLGTETHRMTNSALDEVQRYVDGLPPTKAVTSEELGVSA